MSLSDRKPLCICSMRTICNDCVRLIRMGRHATSHSRFLTAKLVAMIYYAHRTKELQKTKSVGHPFTLSDSLQDMDHLYSAKTTITEVSRKGAVTWGTRTIQSKNYD